MLIQKLPPNLIGKDYTVGDIHGCYDLLIQELSRICFDFNKDRLLSVGDLVDRGTKDLETLSLIKEKWFYSVRGNHEQMMIDALPFYHDQTQENLNSANHHCMNGGQWFVDLPLDAKESCVMLAKSLPILLETVVDGKRIGVVHANIRDSWDSLAESIQQGDKYSVMDSLWSRTRITKSIDSTIKDIDHVFLGHTPIQDIVTLGNTTYLDTGAVFGMKLSIICINDFMKQKVNDKK